MDLKTLCYQMLRDLHLDVSSPSTKLKEDLLMAVSESQRDNRVIPTPFNRAYIEIQTTADVDRYALPKDFVSLVGAVYYLESGDSAKRELKGVGLWEAEALKWSIGGSDEIVEIDGGPLHFAIDTATKEMVLSPSPAAGGTVRFQYVLDLGVIEYEATSGTFTFYEPFTRTTISDPLTSTWTNEWLEQADDVIRSRALYLMWSRGYGGTEVADGKAQRALLQWQDGVNRLKRESGAFVRRSGIRPRM